MRVKQIVRMSAMALALCVGGSMSQAAWMAPAGGWEAEYNAADGMPGNASPAWTPSGVHSIQQDAITGEKVLYMDNNAGGTGNGPFFRLATSPGSGTRTDQVTADFRFRLLDTDLPAGTDQFSVYVVRPRGDGQPGQALFFMNFAMDRIYYYNNSSTMSHVMAPLSNSWHEARLLIDVAANSASLYMDGSDAPAFTFNGWLSTSTSNLTQFGDGTGRVWGEAALSYFHMTNSEFAAIPEPASMGLVVLGGAAMLLKRRRASRA